jgi:hypothetical protein
MALSAFVFSAFVCGVIRFQRGGLTDFYGMSIPTFPLPDWMDASAQAAMWTGALVFAGFAVVWCLGQRRLMPPIVLLPALTHFIWFVPGASLKSFWVVIPFFHSLQYLLIALVMQLKVRIDVVGREHSWHRLGAEARRWGSRNMLGGMLLFIGLPAAFSWLPLPLMTTAGILAAAVNIHHFFVDGVIWKLRDTATSSALMMNIADLAGPTFVDPARPRAVEASDAQRRCRGCAGGVRWFRPCCGCRRSCLRLRRGNPPRDVSGSRDRRDDYVRVDEFLSRGARDGAHACRPRDARRADRRVLSLCYLWLGWPRNSDSRLPSCSRPDRLVQADEPVRDPPKPSPSGE